MRKQISLFGVDVDVLDMQGAVDTVDLWLNEPATTPCRFVVTPNVDHVVTLQKNEKLRAAYKDAAMVVADGAPLILASKLLGRPLPQRVAGSELVPQLFDRIQQRPEKTRVFLLGAMPGVADRAAMQVEKKWPLVDVVSTYSPPFGFENDERECESILARVKDADVDVLIFGVGAPKQELWVHRFQDRIQAKVVFCVGATIDFLAGEKPQAPVWMRRAGLEWVHRVATEPRRLAKRYAYGAWVFPQLFFREWRTAR